MLRVDTLASMNPWLAKAWQAIEPFKLKQLGNMAVEATADMAVRTWSHCVVKELANPLQKMMLLVEKPPHKCPQNVYLISIWPMTSILTELFKSCRGVYVSLTSQATFICSHADLVKRLKTHFPITSHRKQCPHNSASLNFRRPCNFAHQAPMKVGISELGTGEYNGIDYDRWVGVNGLFGYWVAQVWPLPHPNSTVAGVH